MSYGAAIDALTKPPAAAPVFSVVIPEGLSIRESRGRIAKAGVRGSYVEATARRPPGSARAPRSVRTLEGFLFPATYQLRRGATARTLAAKQLAAFEQNISGVSLAYARKRNLTLYDVLIIASMVEREAAVQGDRPLIASVIYNRLRAGMPLQIDATTRYGIRNWSRPLRQSDFARAGRYDTRRRLGLPPTPIGNPGLASIRAAARPAATRYVYFVVKPGTCRHGFFRTQAQFDAAVARYKAASERTGRSPTRC
jgi:peptidoglycan lytic transglycosylase G